MTNTPKILNTPTGIPYTLVRTRVVSQLASIKPLRLYKMYMGTVFAGYVQAQDDAVAAQIARDATMDDGATVSRA